MTSKNRHTSSEILKNDLEQAKRLNESIISLRSKDILRPVKVSGFEKRVWIFILKNLFILK